MSTNYYSSSAVETENAEILDVENLQSVRAVREARRAQMARRSFMFKVKYFITAVIWLVSFLILMDFLSDFALGTATVESIPVALFMLMVGLFTSSKLGLLER